MSEDILIMKEVMRERPSVGLNNYSRDAHTIVTVSYLFMLLPLPSSPMSIRSIGCWRKQTRIV